MEVEKRARLGAGDVGCGSLDPEHGEARHDRLDPRGIPRALVVRGGRDPRVALDGNRAAHREGTLRMRYAPLQQSSA